ncbi:cysteine--tRNA ligase [Saccharicrinis sp. FJH54]|uniref:cysteine--tRNA ligase n=1 Tax=Saccharicrinis sp. FJH54 TaxID=3344665 RepID=UPI0035D42527
MTSKLTFYNSLSRKKEVFKPIKPPYVGLYVCGPTVYGEPHLGHARSAITFDLLFRYLKQLDYKVRYVRNITDVGHLENDSDEGEDKIGKKARLEELEPMEVVQYYTNSYHNMMDKLNVQRPSIEPQASGHLIEQIEFIKTLEKNGWTYESNGSVYFDVVKYNQSHQYGKLSGRKIEDLLNTTRALDGQDEKHNSVDFALWKKAAPEHIMRWPSPWSDGFPGWHLECSVLSTKYLGDTFDIHGGGMDLLFPHHECEIAQGVGAKGHETVKYWLHNNMITIDGQKMGKSLGNFITLEQLFSGDHIRLEKAYDPMTIRFFILQAHYRSTLDFSNEALQASEKGLARLMDGFNKLSKIESTDKSTVDIQKLEDACYAAINDDLNSPIVIASLFDGVRIINSLLAGKDTITKTDLDKLTALFHIFIFDILGLTAINEQSADSGSEPYKKAVDMLLNLRMEAKKNKDWATSDLIRDKLNEFGFEVKDTKEGFEWKLK